MQASDKSIGTFYWVYILQKEATPEYSIRFAIDLPSINEKPNIYGEKVVYSRPFKHPLEALGHKLFLEHISKASLERIINN